MYDKQKISERKFKLHIPATSIVPRNRYCCVRRRRRHDVGVPAVGMIVPASVVDHYSLRQ